jgi:hypothetical protein
LLWLLLLTVTELLIADILIIFNTIILFININILSLILLSSTHLLTPLPRRRGRIIEMMI